MNGFAWHIFRNMSQKVQIDLVIDRSDDVVDIVEIKYSRIRYEMTRKGVQTVLITTLGCEKNKNADVCQRFLVLDDLFI